MDRWQPLRERWDRWGYCLEAESTPIRTFRMYHEFFQQGIREDFECVGAADTVRVGAKAGDRWTYECRSEKTTVATTALVVEYGNYAVAGQQIPAVHMRYDFTPSVGVSGTQRQDRWIAMSGGLMLKLTVDGKTDADSPFGRVHYEEHHTTSLTSLEPRR